MVEFRLIFNASLVKQIKGNSMAHLPMDELQVVWLVVDETNLIIAICADSVVAQCLANCNASRVERSHAGFYELGEHLPIFHS